MSDEERIERTLAAIDAANGEDPRREPGGEPEALVYGRRMSAALERLRPEAGAALRIAVRAQHVERWKVPRASYPEGRAGYLRWRADLGRMHAERAGEIARAVGWDEATIERVASLVQKKRLRADEEAQALEDCACLVFLEHGLDAFAREHDDEKVVDILRKTWSKMSEGARRAAEGLPLSARAQALIEKALSA